MVRYLPWVLAIGGIIAAKRIATGLVALCVVPLVLLVAFEGASLLVQPSDGRPCVPSKYNFIPLLKTDKLDTQRFDHKSINGTQATLAKCEGSPIPKWKVTPIGPVRTEG